MWLRNDYEVIKDIEVIRKFLKQHKFNYTSEECYILWRRFSTNAHANWLQVCCLESFLIWLTEGGDRNGR